MDVLNFSLSLSLLSLSVSLSSLSLSLLHIMIGLATHVQVFCADLPILTCSSLLLADILLQGC